MNNEDKVLEILARMDERLDRMEQEQVKMRNEINESFRATRSELVDAVEVIGKKIDSLEHTVKDMETVTAQNAYDVQLIKRQA